MKKILKVISILVVVVTLNNCEDTNSVFDTYSGTTVLSLKNSTQNIGVCEPTQAITVQSSNVTNTDRTYNLTLNTTDTNALPNEYSVSPTVVIPAGEYSGSTDITIDFAAIPQDAVRSLVFDLEAPQDVIVTRGTTTIAYESVCQLNEVRVDLRFDDYPEEFAYIIRNSNNQIVDASVNASGGVAFGIFADQTSFSKVLCLPSGDYTVTFFDAYGDGNTEGTGSYGLVLLSCDGNNDLFTPLSSSTFGAPGSTLGTNPVVFNFTLP